MRKILLLALTLGLTQAVLADHPSKPFRTLLSVGKTMILPNKGSDNGASLEISFGYSMRRYLRIQALAGTKLWDSYYNASYFGAEAVFIPLHLDSSRTKDFFELELGLGLTNMTRTTALAFLPSGSLRLTLNTLEGSLPLSLGVRVDSMCAFPSVGFGYRF
ncbi:hypothetical protein EBR96_08660 [bacterium]|nr:hypothetical protein [bacterium]